MKKILFISLLFLAHSGSAQYTSDRYHSSSVLSSLGVDSCFSYMVNGKDKVAEDITVFNQNGDDLAVIDIKGETKTVYTYRKDNQMSGRYFYALVPGNSAYELIESDTHLFNDRAQRISVRISDRISGSGEYSRVDNTYKGDSLIRSVYSFNGETVSTTDYAFDRPSSCMVETVVLSAGTTNRSVLKYNSKGFLIAYADVNQNGDTTLSHRYNVDANGRRTEFFAYDGKGVLTQYYRFTYSVKGLLESEEMYTEIKNGNIKRAEYGKRVFEYTYRKR